jgi:hypothetical protein
VSPTILLAVLGSSKTAVCLCPGRAPSFGTTMAAPQPQRFGLYRLWHHHPRRLPSTRLHHRHHRASFAPAASSAATSTPATPIMTSTTASPRTATSTKVVAPTALGYLDIGTRIITSLDHSSASSPVQASALRYRPRCSRYDCGGVSLLGLHRFISSLTIHIVHVVHNAPATTAGGC